MIADGPGHLPRPIPDNFFKHEHEQRHARSDGMGSNKAHPLPASRTNLPKSCVDPGEGTFCGHSPPALPNESHGQRSGEPRNAPVIARAGADQALEEVAEARWGPEPDLTGDPLDGMPRGL